MAEMKGVALSNQLEVEKSIRQIENTIRGLFEVRKALKKTLANPEGFRYKSVSCLSKHCGLSKPTIYGMISSGKLDIVEVGGKMFADQKQLEDMFGPQV